jgi:hypothetical protein
LIGLFSLFCAITTTNVIPEKAGKKTKITLLQAEGIGSTTYF